MKKIISFSLWGDILTYTQGAIKNVELAKEVFPDWICLDIDFADWVFLDEKRMLSFFYHKYCQPLPPSLHPKGLLGQNLQHHLLPFPKHSYYYSHSTL